jgi:hypothetical protein
MLWVASPLGRLATSHAYGLAVIALAAVHLPGPSSPGLESTEDPPCRDQGASRAVGHWIARSVRDPNEYLAVVEFTSLGGATGYASDADRLDLESTAMIDGGPHDRTWEEATYETVDSVTYRE